MSVIKPFNGLVYNLAKVGDMTKIVCPPYDVISPEQENTLKKRSPYNYIHVMLAKADAKHGEDDSRYAKAADTFAKWLKDGILVRDEKPCIYYTKQEYKVLGERHSRMGFLAVMKIEDEKVRIHPHEKTHAGAKEDRFKLWTALKTACSPIFVCFSDRQKKVESIFQRKVAPTKPFIDVIEDDGTRSLAWKLDDLDLIQEIVATFDNQNLFIADGHHRYEVSKRYREMMLAQTPDSTGDEPWNYVMTYFTNIESKDLQIFPIHRIVKNFPKDIAFLENLFRIDSIKKKEDLVVMLAKAGRNEHAFGLYTKKGIQLLRLKNKSQIDEFIKEGSKDYRSLDSLILKAFVFDKLDIKSEDITYCNKEMDECFTAVDNGSAEAAFILNPVRIEQLRSIALNGEKMPPKTTYFYPKALSGIALYQLGQ
ncbi:MAG: DUF1015 domain-containing protein [Candidatus Omnitrophica bacterium]|nr:DUF1015 domain-containing protein [Candidatus Omnitrophota bacterium]